MANVSTSPATEGFRPQAHWAPTTPWRSFTYHLRLLGDLQTASIYRDLRRELQGFTGRLLDVGCGNSPFRHLLRRETAHYQGIDVRTAASFGYANPDVIYYDGRVIPFADASFDLVLCTEVLEHIVNPTETIREMHRVLRPGGKLILTVPWSARFHYQPFDYHRYTPSMLGILLAQFSRLDIRARGTDLSSIGSKLIVAYIRNLQHLRLSDFAHVLRLPLRLVNALAGLPLLLVALPLAHAGIRLHFGSTDDPLGYTVIAIK